MTGAAQPQNTVTVILSGVREGQGRITEADLAWARTPIYGTDVQVTTGWLAQLADQLAADEKQLAEAESDALKITRSHIRVCDELFVLRERVVELEQALTASRLRQSPDASQ